MKKFLIRYFGFVDKKELAARIQQNVDAEMVKVEEDFDVKMLSLTRRALGSISLQDVQKDEILIATFDRLTGSIYKDGIEPMLNRMIRTQERYISSEADGQRQSDFGRGTINGIELVKEEFERAHGAYLRSLSNPETEKVD